MFFGGGIEGIDQRLGRLPPSATVLRRTALRAAAFRYYVRTLATTLLILKRRAGRGEISLIAVRNLVIDLVFACYGGRNDTTVCFLGLTGTVHSDDVSDHSETICLNLDLPQIP